MERIVCEVGERLDEAGAIVAWRLSGLDRAGYGSEAAVALALARHVDLHDAVELVERGCPHDTAVRILL